ncbi:hypothetical protein Droror1_Dr00008455 [Drosera rotundifolia]
MLSAEVVKVEIMICASHLLGVKLGRDPWDTKSLMSGGHGHLWSKSPGHCTTKKLHCLIPAPKGYVTPFPWSKSRDYVPFANAPYKSLTVEKAIQNWIQYEGNVFRFPGGGTQFPQGADKYIDHLASVIPIKNGQLGQHWTPVVGYVASWGAYLWKRNVIAMYFAPRDSHEAQVQFALERGVPAIIGVLGTIKLPYPSRAFDMGHCSRCLIPWGANGGYWVLSGPPINWKNDYKGWQRPKEELQAEQQNIEEIEGKLGIMLDTIKETTRLSLDMLKECKRNHGSVLSA